MFPSQPNVNMSEEWDNANTMRAEQLGGQRQLYDAAMVGMTNNPWALALAAHDPSVASALPYDGADASSMWASSPSAPALGSFQRSTLAHLAPSAVSDLGFTRHGYDVVATSSRPTYTHFTTTVSDPAFGQNVSTPAGSQTSFATPSNLAFMPNRFDTSSDSTFIAASPNPGVSVHVPFPPPSRENDAALDPSARQHDLTALFPDTSFDMWDFLDPSVRSPGSSICASRMPDASENRLSEPGSEFHNTLRETIGMQELPIGAEVSSASSHHNVPTTASRSKVPAAASRKKGSTATSSGKSTTTYDEGAVSFNDADEAGTSLKRKVNNDATTWDWWREHHPLQFNMLSISKQKAYLLIVSEIFPDLSIPAMEDLVQKGVSGYSVKYPDSAATLKGDPDNHRLLTNAMAKFRNNDIQSFRLRFIFTSRNNPHSQATYMLKSPSSKGNKKYNVARHEYLTNATTLFYVNKMQDGHLKIFQSEVLEAAVIFVVQKIFARCPDYAKEIFCDLVVPIWIYVYAAILLLHVLDQFKTGSQNECAFSKSRYDSCIRQISLLLPYLSSDDALTERRGHLFTVAMADVDSTTSSLFFPVNVSPECPSSRFFPVNVSEPIKITLRRNTL